MNKRVIDNSFPRGLWTTRGSEVATLRASIVDVVNSIRAPLFYDDQMLFGFGFDPEADIILLECEISDGSVQLIEKRKGFFEKASGELTFTVWVDNSILQSDDRVDAAISRVFSEFDVHFFRPNKVGE